MDNTLKLITLISIISLSTTPSHANFFSNIQNWANTNRNNYHIPPYPQQHQNHFFNNGTITGFTPPITIPSNLYSPNLNTFQNPINIHNRFNHLPYGMQNLNTPGRIFTDFNTNTGTQTGVTILD